MCGQAEATLAPECPGPAIEAAAPAPFKLTVEGRYRRRDGQIADLVLLKAKPGLRQLWRDVKTDYHYYDDGAYAWADKQEPADIVEYIGLEQETTPPGKGPIADMAEQYMHKDRMPEERIVWKELAVAHNPDRLAIAARLAAGMLASSNPRYESNHYLIEDAITLTDKLIARIKETQV